MLTPKQKKRLGSKPNLPLKTKVESTPVRQGSGKQPVVKNKSMPKKRTSITKSKTSSESGPVKGKNVERKAHRLANGVIRREVKDLRGQSNEITRAADNAATNVETDYQRGAGNITRLRDETTDFLSSMGAQNTATFDAAKAEQTAASAALQQQLGGITDGAVSSVNSDLDSLGIAGMGGGFTGGIQQAGAFEQSQGAIQGAGVQSTLNAMGANTSGLNSILQGMAQGSFMTNMGKNLNDRNDQMGTVEAERMDQQGLVREAIADARGSRKDVFFELLNQLQQTGWGSKSSGSSSSKSWTGDQGDRKGNSQADAAKATLASKTNPKPGDSKSGLGVHTAPKAHALGKFDLKKFNKKNKK